jgi:integrase
LVSRADAVRVKEAHASREKGSLFGLLAATGLRIGEALALNRDEPDLKVGVLTIVVVLHWRDAPTEFSIPVSSPVGRSC